jgi:hypothetical protein
MSTVKQSPLIELVEQLRNAELETRPNYMKCRFCNTPITTEQDKIEIDHQHQYCFTNPNDVAYELGCFRNAPGCILFGKLTDEYTWFGGYEWQLGLCDNCGEHLGWYYQSLSQDYFYGLILKRLCR